MCQSEGCPRIDWRRPPGRPRHTCMATHPGPWMQISSVTTLASTQHGNTLKIENIGRTSWKPLCSSSGHARDDDDDDELYTCSYICMSIPIAAAPYFISVMVRSDYLLYNLAGMCSRTAWSRPRPRPQNCVLDVSSRSRPVLEDPIPGYCYND